MIRFILLSTLLLCSHVFAHTEQNPLLGTWYFISGEYTAEDGKVTKVDNSKFKALRTHSDNNFSAINMGMGEYKGFIEGSYTLKYDSHTLTGTIIEKPLKSSGKHLIGKTLKFDFVINGDIWTTQGQESNVYIKEVWQKLD
ncbi:hypothetical protein KO527_15170 [Pseudoalteromonas sp. C2R02]|uniref:hypothetical protein n=1 Tax=Pseudoalteromonas sp. C2R02 TaxID=2841565 RepID=UPI001C0A5267|nr:hypothetical protein [Pseudoalteromonas sp. C2R02]MBU2970692.1 hypothetical protein [Pseudoalteromonas sp. C2R02]